MRLRLHVNKNLNNQEESELHLMPCKIHGDEPVKVSSFFKPYIRKVDEERESVKEIFKHTLPLFFVLQKMPKERKCHENIRNKVNLLFILSAFVLLLLFDNT